MSLRISQNTILFGALSYTVPPVSGTLAVVGGTSGYGSQIFADATARNAAVPVAQGQLGFTIFDNRLSYATGTGAGNWASDWAVDLIQAATVALTNSTFQAEIVAPALAGNRIITLPAVTSTLATLDGTETLTNKTLTTPVISSISNSGTITIPTGTLTLATVTGTETLTNKTLTAPKFADLGFIADANGNEMLIFDTVTSAVNELTILNAATGNPPEFKASGGDTNISVNFRAKGTGQFNFIGAASSGGLTVSGNTINLVQVTAGATFWQFWGDSSGLLLLRNGSNGESPLRIASGSSGLVTAFYGLSANGLRTAITSKTATYTAVATDHTILCDATSGAITINLPAASGVSGMILVVKKTDASVNTVTIDGNASETIDGATTLVISAQWASTTIQCNGTAWFVI